MKCKECGYEIGDNAVFCSRCGKPVSPGGNKIKCIKCDREMDSNLEYCPRCGGYNSLSGNNKKRRDDDDDDDEGGIFGSIGGLIGKLFGG